MLRVRLQQMRVGRLRTNGSGLCSRYSKKLIGSLNMIFGCASGATHCGREVWMYHPRPVLIWNKDILKVFAYCGQGPSIPNFPWTLAHGPRWFVPKIATGAATSNKSPSQQCGAGRRNEGDRLIQYPRALPDSMIKHRPRIRLTALPCQGCCRRTTIRRRACR
jgi:hypothetical protein